MTEVVGGSQAGVADVSHEPGLRGMVVAAIALGIGTTTAIFSVVNAVVLKPVPFPEPDRIVQLQVTRDGAAFGTSVSPAKFMVWRELRGEVFSDLAGFMIGVPLTFTQAEVPEVIAAARVTEGYFRVFGAPIARGRTFTPDEDLPNAAPAVVLSHAFWRDRLAADPDVVGKAVSLSGAPHTVVGVVGEGFDLRELGDPEVFVPLQLDPATTDHAHTFTAAARLAPGVSLEQAQARMAASVASFHERHPNGGSRGRKLHGGDAAGGAGRRYEPHVVGAARRRRVRAADRLRQRCELAARFGPRGGGERSPFGLRSGPVAGASCSSC